MALREWTEHELNLLRELWESGLSSTEIGHRIGGRSKNSIIGKAHRLNLSLRPHAIQYGRTPRPVVAAPIPRPGPVTLPRLKSIPPEPPVNFRPAPTLSDQTCCWPLGEPGTPSFRFCTNRAKFGRPYCPEHHKRAYLQRRDLRDAAD